MSENNEISLIPVLEELRGVKIAEINRNQTEIDAREKENETLRAGVKTLEEVIEKIKQRNNIGHSIGVVGISGIGGKYFGKTLSQSILEVIQTARVSSGLLVPDIMKELKAGGFQSEAKDLYPSVYSVAMNLIKQEKIKAGEKDGKRTFMRKEPF